MYGVQTLLKQSTLKPHGQQEPIIGTKAHASYVGGGKLTTTAFLVAWVKAGHSKTRNKVVNFLRINKVYFDEGGCQRFLPKYLLVNYNFTRKGVCVGTIDFSDCSEQQS